MSTLGKGGLLGAGQDDNTALQVRDALVGKTSQPRVYRFGGFTAIARAVLGGQVAPREFVEPRPIPGKRPL